jgi:hypothetical protein
VAAANTATVNERITGRAPGGLGAARDRSLNAVQGKRSQARVNQCDMRASGANTPNGPFG